MFRVYSLLLTGVLVVAGSSILVRWIGDVPFSVIAFYRLAISTALLFLYRVSQKGNKALLIQFHWHYALAGFFLAAHLITWIASLQMTTIAHSIFLEGTHPLFAVLFSVVLLKEFPKRATLPFFFSAMIGMLLIVYADAGVGETGLLGDGLALISAMFVALYLCIARLHKKESDFIKYLIYVYGAASIFCLLYLKTAGHALTGFPLYSWGLIGLLALGPNLIGHSLLNWASRHMEIYKVNLALLLEPVLATLSGMVFVHEFPGGFFYGGALMILVSVSAIIWLENHTPRPG